MNLTRRKFLSLAPAIAGTAVLGVLVAKQTGAPVAAPPLLDAATYGRISEAMLIAAQRVVDPPVMREFVFSTDQVYTVEVGEWSGVLFTDRTRA